MWKRMVVPLTLALLLKSCGGAPEAYWSQEVSQLAACEETAAVTEQDEPVCAVWIPVMQYAAWMTGRTEAQFRASVEEAFDRMAEFGVNTVFAHVRAYGDAYYRSELFPAGAYLTGDFDPLEIMIEAAHSRGMALHAWINPLRCGSPEAVAATDPRFPLRQWYDAGAPWLVQEGGRLWLDPAYPEVRELVAAGAAEILAHYEADGLHIDDYFYPTTDPAFGAEAFTQSGAADLGDFRRENVSRMVQSLYETVKAQDPALIFSISPQGNISADYEQVCADVQRWSSTPGFADWILPQIYYGFRNETMPFTETLRRWEELATAVQLIPGLAPYKIGAEDRWAGSGAAEWQEDACVLSKEVQAVLESDAAGMAFYSYEALFSPQAEAERERIRRIFAEK